MANVINATSTGNGGLITTGDDSGILNIQTNETTAVSVDASQNLTFTNGINAPNTFGFKNRLINGAMVIDQRNGGASVTPADGTYTVDRWVCGTSQSSKFTVQQSSTAPTGFKNSVLITSSSSYSVVSTDYFLFRQNIEGFNTADFAWGTASAATVTLSFWVRSSLTGQFGGTLNNGGINRAYPFAYTINAANTWEQKSITIAGDQSGTWATDNTTGVRVTFDLGSGSNYLASSGSWAGSNLVGATGDTKLVATSGATLYIAGVQLEKGTQATSFDFRSIGTELALCQRYFVRMIDPPLRGVAGGVTDASRVTCSLPVQMRSSPTATVTQVGGTGQSRFFDGVVSSGAISTINTTYSTTQRIEFDIVTTANTYTIGRPMCLYIDAAGNYSSAFSITAEL